MCEQRTVLCIEEAFMLGRVIVGLGSFVIGFYLGRQYERARSVRKQLEGARESGQGPKRLSTQQAPAS
jgi:hypothetical protein